MIERFLEEIEKRDVLQYKYLSVSLEELEQDEKSMLEEVLRFFEEYYFAIGELAEAYLAVVESMREETKYFLQMGSYRNTSYRDVAATVYFNEAYMERYMIGLVLSDYMWINHIYITRWLKEQFSKTKGKKYLEIGPGFGNYFLMAVNNDNFEECIGVDISPKSVEGTRNFVTYFCQDKKEKWLVECKDFFDFEVGGVKSLIVSSWARCWSM